MTSPVVYFWMGLPIKWKCLSQSVHPWQMNMWKCLLLLVLWPVHLNILSFSLLLFPPLEYLVFPIPTHSTTDTSKIKTAEGDPPSFSLSLSPPSPCSSLFPDQRWFPGSGGCSSQPLAGKLSLFARPVWLFWHTQLFLIFERAGFFFPPSSAWSASLEGQAKVFWLECEKLQASPVECCDQTADSLTRQRKTVQT